MERITIAVWVTVRPLELKKETCRVEGANRLPFNKWQYKGVCGGEWKKKEEDFYKPS